MVKISGLRIREAGRELTIQVLTGQSRKFGSYS